MIDLAVFFGPFLTFITLGAGGLVWCLRLEGRVNAAQVAIETLQKELEAHNGLAVQIARVEEQLKSVISQIQTQNALIRKLVKGGLESD